MPYRVAQEWPVLAPCGTVSPICRWVVPDCVLSQKRGRRRGGAAGVVGWRCRLKRIILAFLAWTVQSGRKSHSPMAEWVAIPSEANFSGFFAWTVHPGQECHWLAEKGGL